MRRRFGKQFLAGLLLAAMVLSFTACGPKIPKLEEFVSQYSGPLYEKELTEAGIYGLSRKELRKAWGEVYSFNDDRQHWRSGDKWVTVYFEADTEDAADYGEDRAVSATVSVTMYATVTEFVANTQPIITPDEGSWELRSGDKIFFSMGWLNDEQAAQMQVGTQLKIEYDGLLMETYPMQIHPPYSVEIVGFREIKTEPVQEPESSKAAEPETTAAPGEPETEKQQPSAGTAQSIEEAQLAFALQLFQQAASEKQGENVLVAPLSMQLALAMTANGAGGDTLAELENALGGGAPVEELNQYLRDCLQKLQSTTMGRFLIADSVWIRDDKDRLAVEEDFIKKVEDWYDAQVFTEPFDDGTVNKLNDWVKEKTDGMIPSVKDKLSGRDMVLLVNAMTFDAEWAEPFAECQVCDRTFTALDGRVQNVKMMSAEFQRGYIKDDQAQGFKRQYQGQKFSFAALLPDEGVDLYEYIKGLTPERLKRTLTETYDMDIDLAFPKFSYDFKMDMIPALQSMGIDRVFSTEGRADLTGMGTSPEGNLYIAEAFQKTFICVDELGTKAGAVSVEVAVPECELEVSVVLDRPFVYMIVDNETNLPLFLGVVTEIPE